MEKAGKPGKIGNCIKRLLVFGMLVIGLTSLANEANESNKDFPYTSVYDVNKDVCVELKEYEHKFTYMEVKNSKLIVEFPQRPGEMIFVNSKNEMYVFNDTLEKCLSYRKHFLEEMEKQLKEEEENYKYSDLENE